MIGATPVIFSVLMSSEISVDMGWASVSGNRSVSRVLVASGRGVPLDESMAPTYEGSLLKVVVPGNFGSAAWMNRVALKFGRGLEVVTAGVLEKPILALLTLIIVSWAVGVWICTRCLAPVAVSAMTSLLLGTSEFVVDGLVAVAPSVS